MARRNLPGRERYAWEKDFQTERQETEKSRAQEEWKEREREKPTELSNEEAELQQRWRRARGSDKG